MAKSYLASFQQRQYCWLQNLDPHSSAYTIPLIFTIEGCLNIACFKQAVSNLINENEIFRANFSLDQGAYFIKAADQCEIEFPIIDMSNENAQSILQSINTLISQPFDLKKEPLYRTLLIKKEDESYIWCLVLQHSICDLRTKELICTVIGNNYDSLMQNQSINADIQNSNKNYADYSLMQKEWLLSDSAIQMKTFWKKLLTEIPVTLSLPTDFVRPSYLQLQGSVEPFEFDEKTTSHIKEFSRRYEVTPYLCLLTAYTVLLSRYSNQDQFIVGIPFTNRRNTGFQDTMGCFVNTLPIPIDLKECCSMADAMRAIRRTMLLAHRNQELSTETIIKEVNKNPPSLDRNPLYQAGFTFEPLSKLSLEGCSSQQRYMHHGGSQLDIFATLWEDEDTLQGVFEYNNTLFSAETIQQWTRNFCYIVQNFIEHPDHPVHSIPLIDPSELNAIESYSKPPCVSLHNVTSFIDLFSIQTSNYPSKAALIFNGQEISYSKLNTMANKVALYLKASGAEQNQIVGIFMDRSVEMIVAMVGILKAGAAYLPLDPDFPSERITFIIHDSGVNKIIVNHKLRDQILVESDKVITIESVLSVNNSDVLLPSDTHISNETAAYMIYTSGSTGNPKGVVINHGNLSNFIHSMVHEPGITTNDRMLAITTISFDIHVMELLVPLAAGATIVLAPQECLSDGTAMAELIGISNISMMQATPTTWKLLCAAGWSGSKTLKILCGGEAMSLELAKLLLQRCNVLYNMYGPTETTVWSTCYRVTGSERFMPIGKPIENTAVVIMDKWGNVAPLGAWGELCIGGAGVTRGYHNRQELTQKKFRDMQFILFAKMKYYLTGDICRFRTDGVLEFAGRSDDQIKIRGYRIELEEIERVIETHPDIASAAVVTHGDKEFSILVAFVVPGQNVIELVPATIKQFLLSKLPDYMIPARFIKISDLPLTPNKKIDRKKLKAAGIVSESKKKDSIDLSGNNEIEKKLIEIWTQSLLLDVSDIDSNFFDAGGNSFLLLQLKENILTNLNFDVSTTVLFQYSTVRTLAQYLVTKNQTNDLQGKKERVFLQKKALQSAAKRIQR